MSPQVLLEFWSAWPLGSSSPLKQETWGFLSVDASGGSNSVLVLWVRKQNATNWVTSQPPVLLTTVEAGRTCKVVAPGHQRGRVLRKSLPGVADCGLPAVSLREGRGQGLPLCPFHESLCPMHEGPMLVTRSLRPHLLRPPHWALGLQHMIFWGVSHIQIANIFLIWLQSVFSLLITVVFHCASLRLMWVTLHRFGLKRGEPLESASSRSLRSEIFIYLINVKCFISLKIIYNFGHQILFQYNYSFKLGIIFAFWIDVAFSISSVVSLVLIFL